MSEATPAERLARADAVLDRCRDRGNVRMSHLEMVRNELAELAAEYGAALDELAAARDLAWRCGYVLRQMPTSLSELLDVEYEDLPGWFLSYRAPSGGDER